MIHYHGTPMSGDAINTQALQSRHAMVSFSAPDCLPQVAEVCQSFALDNGAFSCWKSGKELDLFAFREWLTDWCQHPGFDWYLLPDVIDGTEKENDLLISKWVTLCPAIARGYGVPVWHLHESLERLHKMATNYQRVAFGSSGDFATVGTESWWRRMTEAMDAICPDGKPLAKLHGLRMLDPQVFSVFPFSSADSTNVARNIGIDKAWSGPYVPPSKKVRALVMMDRIESHASASRWNPAAVDNGRNLDLFG